MSVRIVCDCGKEVELRGVDDLLAFLVTPGHDHDWNAITFVCSCGASLRRQAPFKDSGYDHDTEWLNHHHYCGEPRIHVVH